MPDLNDLEARGVNEPMGYCFPHWFVLPMYSSASSYRFRPLGPEETLMEIWSLTRVPGGRGAARGRRRRRCGSTTTPAGRPIPTQDFSNLPKQQRGLHSKGFEYMRFSELAEGHLGNLERVIDGFLAGLPYERLLPALREVNVNPLERPLVDLDLRMATFADVSEGVRDTLAAYTHALDDGRTDDVVATFCPDGAIDMGELGSFEGHDALRAAYARVGAAASRSATSSSTRTSPSGTTTEAKADQRRRRSSSRARTAGRSRSSAATTTSCTRRTAPGASTTAGPSSSSPRGSRTGAGRRPPHAEPSSGDDLREVDGRADAGRRRAHDGTAFTARLAV